MELTGEYEVPAPRDEVWRAINDPDVLRDCIPGAESLEKVSDTEFNAAVRAKVGPVKARFNGAVTLSDFDPPNACTIAGEGKGGAAGFAKGSARVRLDETPDGGTRLGYRADVQVGGKLAQIGSRLVQGTARKMADEFFSNLAARLGGSGEAAEPGGPQSGPPVMEPLPGPTPEPTSARGIAAHWWIPALVVAVVILLVAVSRLG